MAARLCEAQSVCPRGVGLLIVEGFRPLWLQRVYFDRYAAQLAAQHPDWDVDAVRAAASRYVAPPDIVPPHCTGGAVDVTLVDGGGRELNLGTRVNASPEESHGACFTEAPGLSPEAAANRRLLREVMERAGFVNYGTEWWHWSYGDRYWAYFASRPTAIYGLAMEPAGPISRPR